MENPIFYQLSAVLVLAAATSLVARLLRQPLVIAYIVTGFLAGPSLLNIIHSHEAFESFSQIGITLLLFIIGLGLNVNIIKTTGKPVLMSFLSVVLGVGGLGLLAATALGFTGRESLFIAIALIFSSTIIVVKSLSDKKEQGRLYGQIAIGQLLVEDIAAMLVLLFASASGGGAGTANDAIALLGKGILLGSAMAVIGGLVMPRLSKLFASSQELLYAFAIAWAFGVASAFSYAGFSIEVGALFAGVTLAHLPYGQAIATRLKPLRDFFIVLFFINLGQELKLDNLSESLIPALIFSGLVLISKPLLIMISLGLLGYTKQTGFKSAIHLSQISEFSVVLIALAVSQNLVNDKLLAVITLTALITIAVSAYFMKYDDQLYKRFEKVLGIFERSQTKRELKALSHYPLVLIGYREGGADFIKTFKQMKKPYVVIDYNPDIIETLEHQHLNHLYGDVTDVELLDEIGVHNSDLVISTLTNPDTNRILAAHINRKGKETIFICHANKLDDAESLYEAGAAYVLMPHFIGDQHINQFIKRNGSNKQAFAKYRQTHLIALGNTALRV